MFKFIVGLMLFRFVAGFELISSEDFVSFKKDVKCFSQPQDDTDKCRPKQCSRQIIDGLFSDDEIQALMIIVEKGLSLRQVKGDGGPSIFDLNTGFIRDSNGLENIFFNKHTDIFTPSDFEVYGAIISKLKRAAQERMQIETLYFTAPTFVTRLDGRNSNWEPKGIHDEYWHLHVDQNSTAHYDYSGLLYLSTFGKDFTGGRLKFFGRDEETIEQIIEPRGGRAAFFTSGPENPHSVERVASGQRFVLSFWFTCDPKREFQIFLDGKAHIAFGKKYIERFQQQQQQQQQRGQEKEL